MFLSNQTTFSIQFYNSKHIEMDYHFVRDKVAVGALITRYMPTTIQVANIFTKALDKYPFIKFRSNLGVVSIPHFIDLPKVVIFV